MNAASPHDVPPGDWTLEILRSNLQAAVDLEFWTIPFYLSALYSVRDQTSEEYQLIRSVVVQEMLHFELVGNVANAYGVDVKCVPPIYGCGIPHLDFTLDKHDPQPYFTPFSSAIGPLDRERINAMCLVEYPEWDEPLPEPQFIEPVWTRILRPQRQHRGDEYGSIGALYRAIEVGAALYKNEIRPRNQLDDFQRYYRGDTALTVTFPGDKGWPQVKDVLVTISEQGEGQNKKHQEIPRGHRNTATDPAEAVDHYGKFLQVRASGQLPKTYDATETPPPGSSGAKAQERLQKSFPALCRMLQDRMAGHTVDEFWTQMAAVGAQVRTCWKHGAIPKFSRQPA